MPGNYTMEQKIMVDSVDQLAKRYNFKYFYENLKKGSPPSEFWQVLGEGGYMGMLAPEEYGGSALKAEDLALFVQAMARNGLASYQLIQQIACSYLLARFGGEEQKRKYLPGLIAGTRFSYAWMERAEGMSLYDVTLTASRQGDAYRLDGYKAHVVGAKESSHLVVTARTEATRGEDGGDGISLFLVDPNTNGIEMIPRELNVRVTPAREWMMITGDTFYDVRFTGVEVARDALVGREHSGGAYVQSISSFVMMMMAAASIGWGERVLDMAVEYAKTRVIYEEPIGSYQAIQHPMVRAKTDLELAKLVLERAASAIDDREDEDDVTIYTSVAKYAATEAAYHAFDIAIQAHGGSGFDRDTGIITLWPLVLLFRIIPLNNEVILERFAEAALGLPAAGSH